MKKINHPQYRIDTKPGFGYFWATLGVWDTTLYGEPTQENLENFRKQLNRSLRFNKPIQGQGYHPDMRIVSQTTGATICEAHAPLFEFV